MKKEREGRISISERVRRIELALGLHLSDVGWTEKGKSTEE